MRLTKYVAVALVVAFALSGCGLLHREPAPLRGGPVAVPQPTGVLYGRVMHDDGASAPRSSVEVAVTDRNTLGTVLAAVGTLGLACFIPTLCEPVRTRPDGQGLWSLDQEELEGAPGLRVTAQLGSDGPASGPSTMISLPASDEVPRRIPDLIYWDPELDVTDRDGRIDVGWPSNVPTGETFTYTTAVVETRGHAPGTHVVTEDATATTARVDARVYADVPSELQVIARTTTRFDDEDLDTAYHSAAVPLPELTPPSRDAACLAEDAKSGRLEPAVSPCPLTDGNTEDRNPVMLPTDCAADSTASAAPECERPDHPRTCVRLPEPRDVSLVVLRSPFSVSGDDVIELLDADHRVVHSTPGQDSGRMEYSHDLHPVHLEQPVRAALVCTHNGRGTALSLTELSVW